MLSKVKKDYPNIIEGFKIIPSGQLTEIIKVLRPEYEPILWGSTDRRLKDYAIQLDYIKKRDIPLRISKEFKLVELPSFVKSEEIIDLIKNSEFEAFKKLTPNCVSSEFFNLQKEVGKITTISEANSDSRLIELDLNLDEDINIL